MPFTTSTSTTVTTPALKHSLPAVAVHTAFRREFRLVPPLVGRAADGDTDRARVLSRHVDFLLRGLHHHHQLEEELVVPLIRLRAPAVDLGVVDQMQAQHDTIDGVVASARQAVEEWQLHAAAAVRDQLAGRLELLHALLVEHLDAEEQQVLPLAERHLTAAEWDALGRRAEADQRRDERALTFGLIQYEGDPAVLATMLAPLPWPARRIVPLVARRAYRRYATAIHGTPTP